MSHDFSVPFGMGALDFAAPAGWHVDTATINLPSSMLWASGDFDALVSVQDYDRAVVVFTDATRQSPDQMLAKRVLSQLKGIGLGPDRVSFLCAVGMHRPSTRAEKITKLGHDIVADYLVEDHDPSDIVTVGKVDGIAVQVNRRVAAPGTLVVALGVVEPHQYAGYSGGAKTVVIGCGGPEMIAHTHGPHFLDKPGTRLGRLDGNEFQAFVRQAGQLTGLRWVSNVVLDSSHDVLFHADGSPEEVHDGLVARARRVYEVPVDAPYDVVVAGVGAPKDANLYQASRAATYVGLSGQPVLRSGGVIIVPAPIPEGGGDGQGERNFIAALRKQSDLASMVTRMRRKGCLPGEQRAYMLAQLLGDYQVIVVGAYDEDVVRAAHLVAVGSMEEAFDVAEAFSGPSPRMLVVPNALQTLPRPR